MKIYIYDYTDNYGKPHYQKIEISDEDANDWINIDYERRLSEAEPGQVVEKRTAQQIQDEIDKDFINSDRRNHAHKGFYNTFTDDEGNEESIIETYEDEGLTPMEAYEEELRVRELQEKIKNALAILTETQRRRVLMRFVEDLTLEEIAKRENCDISSVKESIDGAIKKIKKNF